MLADLGKCTAREADKVSGQAHIVSLLYLFVSNAMICLLSKLLLPYIDVDASVRCMDIIVQ